MKFTISKSNLQRGLGRIQSIVEKRNTMPILANVLLEVSTSDAGGRLELAATDLEVGIRSRHECEVDTPGGVTASAKKLFEIVRELPDEPVKIEVSSNAYLSIHCARSEFTLAGTTAEEYPTLPEFSPKRTILAQAVVVGEMIERTIYAASADETRYNLNGVLGGRSVTELVLVSVDSGLFLFQLYEFYCWGHAVVEWHPHRLPCFFSGDALLSRQKDDQGVLLLRHEDVLARHFRRNLAIRGPNRNSWALRSILSRESH